jgi:hypothetical protein
MKERTTMVDQTALKTNQVVIIALCVAAFILDWWVIVPAVATVMAMGTLVGKPGFLPVYRALAALRVVRPNPVPDDPAPHRFAQGLGASVLVVASLLFVFGAAFPAWIVAWLVVFLASLNAFAGFCAGCFLFHHLAKAGFPGFAGGSS